MKRLILFLGAVMPIVLCAQAQSGQWKLVTDSAEWKQRDSQGEVVYDGYMWIFGGWHSSFESPPRDVWKSKSGKNWTLVTDTAPWLHSDLPMSIAYRGKMWMMGGWYNGRLEDRSASNQVWSSTDGESWKLETKSAEWSARCAAAIVEFKGEMYMLGGTKAYYEGNSSDLLNDVWKSKDGSHWELVTANAEWSPRAFLQAVVLNDRIYVMGGGNYDPEYAGRNDVWSSSDGVHWELEVDSAPWHPRIWHSAVVYRDCMWVMGGWSNHPYTNWADVWYSKDGRHWTQLENLGMGWKERHEQSLFVFKNRIWIAGGMTPPLVNDVWSLKLPRKWKASGSK